MWGKNLPDFGICEFSKQAELDNTVMNLNGLKCVNIYENYKNKMILV